MSIELNHTIVFARDKQESAEFFAGLFGLPGPKAFGPFLAVALDNGITLDFADTDGEVTSQHYAFLVSDDKFDEIYGRIAERDITHWAHPDTNGPKGLNHRDGGRGTYFEDPSGHFLEILTRPYGSGG